MTDEERILILAPLGRDAPLAQGALRAAGLAAEVCSSMADLCAQIAAGAGAVVLTEEVLEPPHGTELLTQLEAAPSWSDLPLVVFGSQGSKLGELGNVTLLDRPVRMRHLVSTLRSSLRARRKQYETRDLLAQLEQSVRERDQFLAMLGHELRNPLAAILTAVELTERGSATPERERAVIARQTRHLSRLVDDLLEVARVTSGKIVLHKSPVELGAMVRNAMAGLLARAAQRGIKLATLHPPAPVTVQVDPVRLEQVVVNLVGNAIKYTQRGGRVEVGIETDAGQAVLRVSDNGIGISPEMLPRIFELFTQAPRAIDRSEGGMGIGLTLVQRLVELHGGSVRATSEGVGRGSQFEVRLPLGEAAAAANSAAPATPVEARPRRVLLVEDNADSRELLHAALEHLGHDVVSCEDGNAAVEQAISLKPETMVVDLGLPGRDGYQVARAVRAALGAGVRLIALTGYGQSEDKERALAAGFDAFLTKPAELDVLHRAISAA